MLDEWYSEIDKAECAALSSSGRAPALAAVQSQVDDALANMLDVSQRIQSVSIENEAIRGEIAVLLPTKSVPK